MKKILLITFIIIISMLLAVFISAYSKHQNYNSTHNETKLIIGGNIEDNKKSKTEISSGRSTPTTDNRSNNNLETANKISKVATSIENYLIMGKTLNSLIVINEDSTNKYAPLFNFIENSAYSVGTPNYTELGLKKKDYQDSYGNEFIIGILSNEKKYQILGMQKGEIDSKKISLMGNYSARRYSGNGGNVAGLIFNPETGEPYQNGDIIK